MEERVFDVQNYNRSILGTQESKTSFSSKLKEGQVPKLARLTRMTLFVHLSFVACIRSYNVSFVQLNWLLNECLLLLLFQNKWEKSSELKIKNNQSQFNIDVLWMKSTSVFLCFFFFFFSPSFHSWYWIFALGQTFKLWNGLPWQLFLSVQPLLSVAESNRVWGFLTTKQAVLN